MEELLKLFSVTHGPCKCPPRIMAFNLLKLWFENLVKLGHFQNVQNGSSTAHLAQEVPVQGTDAQL